jgi:hypothetical protein
MSTVFAVLAVFAAVYFSCDFNGLEFRREARYENRVENQAWQF